MLRREKKEEILSEAEDRLRSEFDSVQKTLHGYEHFHSDIGEYWYPPSLTVKGDLEDMENLKTLSQVMDEYDMEVHQLRGKEFARKSKDGYARLVINSE